MLSSPAVDRENGISEDKNAKRIETIYFTKSSLGFIEEDNSIFSLLIDIEEMVELYGLICKFQPCAIFGVCSIRPTPSSD